MSDGTGQSPRKQTPRVPSSFLYVKVVPVAIGVMVVVLLIVIVAVLMGFGQVY